MYIDILRSIAGVGVFPLISLALFVAVFVGVLVQVARADRAQLERRAALPLDGPDRPRRAPETLEETSEVFLAGGPR